MFFFPTKIVCDLVPHNITTALLLQWLRVKKKQVQHVPYFVYHCLQCLFSFSNISNYGNWKNNQGSKYKKVIFFF